MSLQAQVSDFETYWNETVPYITHRSLIAIMNRAIMTHKNEIITRVLNKMSQFAELATVQCDVIVNMHIANKVECLLSQIVSFAVQTQKFIDPLQGVDAIWIELWCILDNLKYDAALALNNLRIKG